LNILVKILAVVTSLFWADNRAGERFIPQKMAATIIPVFIYE
jgi:hypothetical protein